MLIEYIKRKLRTTGMVEDVTNFQNALPLLALQTYKRKNGYVVSQVSLAVKASPKEIAERSGFLLSRYRARRTKKTPQGSRVYLAPYLRVTKENRKVTVPKKADFSSKRSFASS